MVAASGTNPFNKEMAIRKRIANIFNKREEDFPSLKEYNDYLEEVEDMIFDLIEGNNIPAIEAKIARYQEENKDQIINAQARKAEELAAAMKASKGPPVQNDPSDMALGQNAQVGISGVAQGQYAPAVPGAAFGQPRPTGVVPQPVSLGGLDGTMGIEDEATMKLRAERSARAGGWTVEISKKRAMEEAFSSLWV
ncbi:uncharacterized protein LOC116249816 [Nymphaea colorata]|nr:uncharacterized protein LOC116249816 [Nymphaea colorata]